MAQSLFSGNLMELLAINLEIQRDQADLVSLGLTGEEVEGYLEFYATHYFGDLNNDLQLPVPKVQDRTGEMA